MTAVDYPKYFISELIERAETIKNTFCDDQAVDALQTEKLNDCYTESQEFLGSDWFEETEHMSYLLKCTEIECAQYLIDQLNNLLQ